MLAGPVAVDDAGEVVAPSDVGVQAEQIIRAVLAVHGATFADVRHIRSFMTNLDDLPAYGAVRRQLLPTANPPASTTVEVSGLFPPGAVLEVQVAAAVTHDRR